MVPSATPTMTCVCVCVSVCALQGKYSYWQIFWSAYLPHSGGGGKVGEWFISFDFRATSVAAVHLVCCLRNGNSTDIWFFMTLLLSLPQLVGFVGCSDFLSLKITISNGFYCLGVRFVHDGMVYVYRVTPFSSYSIFIALHKRLLLTPHTRLL